MFALSEGYELYMGRWSRLLAPRFGAFVGLRDGERILDVGTGTGAAASTLEASLPHSEVVGVDPSAAFIAHATKNAHSARLRFEIGDAQALPFGDASFDQTVSMLVMNFIPDHAKALSEMRRVTRPGGGISACVWDYGDGMESLRIFWDEVVALEPAAAPKHERNMKLSRRGELGDLWRQAGLEDVREESIVIEQSFSSFDDYWAPFLKGTGPGGSYVASLPEERRRQLEARIRGRLLDGPFARKARAWCVKSKVPLRP